MAIRPIRLYPDAVLRTRADEVPEIDAGVRKLVADMWDTMDHAEGVGLAAPQVGVSRRVFVYDDNEGHRGALVNPRYTVPGSDSEFDYEGCLSVPEIGGEIDRPLEIDVTGLDESGDEVRFHADGLLARICQHEIDHLDGIMFMQRLTGDARKEAMAAIRSAEWFGMPAIIGDLVFEELGTAEVEARQLSVADAQDR
ncbi:peptide deformylase [Dietzia timorensis]|uniref:Peptide deformylase n=1 Tax=Dietzia timorensis TaxID=499555 RepID=A0A173LLW1_9ACTN|nr:peptide deformylase [Dietzia timorensis]ANI92491.1 Peptide deformylase 1 [Dietzia timorensis]